MTGFPAFTARRLTEQLLATDRHEQVYLLVLEKFRADADAFVAALPPEQAARVRLLEGDVASMDLASRAANTRRWRRK